MNNDQDKEIEDLAEEIWEIVKEDSLASSKIGTPSYYTRPKIFQSLRSYGSKEYERGIKDSQWTALNESDYERGRKSVLDELAEEKLKLRKGFAYKPPRSIK